MTDVVEVDHHELEDDHNVSSDQDVSSPPLSHDVIGDSVHPDRKHDVENEDEVNHDGVANDAVIDDVANVQFDVEDDEVANFSKMFTKWIEVASFTWSEVVRVGMYLTLRASHAGVVLVDQTNEVGEADVTQQVED